MAETFSKSENYLSEVSWDAKIYEITFKLLNLNLYTPVTSFQI